MNIAFIPVRGGSKSIPLKNIKPFCGKPLVFWTAKAACESHYIDRVYISTDNQNIRKSVEAFRGEETCFKKIEITDRSPESATDTASTEIVMLEFCNTHDFDSIALIQATSPLLTWEDIDRGFAIYKKSQFDSVLSVVAQKRFNWSVDKKGIAYPSNYDVYNRPRRQDFDGYYVENGAFYITSREALLKTKSRLSGNIGVCEMSEDTYFEIDEPSDWIILETLCKRRLEKEDKLL